MPCFFFKATDAERRQLITFYRDHLNELMQDVEGFIPLKPRPPQQIMPIHLADARSEPFDIQNLIHGLTHSKDWQIVVAKHGQQMIGLLISNGLQVQNAQGRHLRNIETLCVAHAWRRQGVAQQMIDKLKTRFAVDCVRCEPSRFDLWERRGFGYPTAFSQLDATQQHLASVRFYLAQHGDDFQHGQQFAWPSLADLRAHHVDYANTQTLNDKALLFNDIFKLGQQQAAHPTANPATIHDAHVQPTTAH